MVKHVGRIVSTNVLATHPNATARWYHTIKISPSTWQDQLEKHKPVFIQCSSSDDQIVPVPFRAYSA